MTGNKVGRDNAGRYKHTGNHERLCVCGHTLGDHSAEKVDGQRPCFAGDFGHEPCACECFKLKRKPRTARGQE